jgi:hypothetical protein
MRIVAQLAFLLIAGVGAGVAQTVQIDDSPAVRGQVIEGFGSCISSDEGKSAWWQELFLDDLGASILRIDLVPRFRSPWSDLSFHSPWFRGRNAQPYAFNYEIDASREPRHYVGTPSNPLATEFTTNGGNTYYNGPEGNRARTYTGAADYGKEYGGRRAPIAVMGPNIDDNIARYFDLEAGPAPTARAIIAGARARDPGLGRFKLIGSTWSPAPWLKVPSGNSVGDAYGFWPFGIKGTPFPFISGGNFVGGRLDVSGEPRAQFDDSALPADAGGPNAAAVRGPTSALVQFARCTAAWLRTLQNHIGHRFYAISIQNELNFETFYNSCTYPDSRSYILALRAVRAELDKYEDLRDIRIMGPEDLLTDARYGLWQFGGGATSVHKNLQYLQNLGADERGMADLGLFCIHGYGQDGVSAAGADPVAWTRWAEGWTTSPGPGIPASVKGFTAFGKRSWMTETSGEATAWRSPATGYPGNGAWSIALRIHQALTAGRQSAWVYWQLTDGKAMAPETLTDATRRASSPKFTAARHFFRHIRPGAVRVGAAVTGAPDVLASAFLHEPDRTLVTVLVNTGAAEQEVAVRTPAGSAYASFDTYTSSETALWSRATAAVSAGGARVRVPGYGVMTLVASAAVVEIVEHPEAQTVEPGGRVVFSVGASGPSPLVYAWRREGVALAGANGSTLVIENVAPSDSGDYTVEVTSGALKTVSRAATLRVETPQPGGFVNLSVRSQSLAGAEILIAGFVLQGSGGQRGMLVRGMGPYLAAFGVPGVLADPDLTIYETVGGQSVVRLANDNWGGTAALKQAFARSGAAYSAEVLPDVSRDAAVLGSLAGGSYTAHINGRDGGTGVALAEVFDTGGASGPRLVNLSARCRVGTGGDILIAGFVIDGNVPRRILVRAMGPYLGKFGVAGVLGDPQLQVYRGSVLVAENDNWGGSALLKEAFRRAGAAYSEAVLPDDSADAALYLTLVPGAYTAQVRGASGGTGVGLIEVFMVES